MAEFKEELVINALHTDKAEVGKKYYFADDLVALKDKVEKSYCKDILISITNKRSTPFCKEHGGLWKLLYPYEEPPKKRMTYRQLAEWMAKGNGEYTDSQNKYCMPMYAISYAEERRDEPIWENCVIRPWDSEDWIEPTVDIYERDCKGGKE